MFKVYFAEDGTYADGSFSSPSSAIKHAQDDGRRAGVFFVQGIRHELIAHVEGGFIIESKVGNKIISSTLQEERAFLDWLTPRGRELLDGFLVERNGDHHYRISDLVAYARRQYIRHLTAQRS